MVDQDLLYDSLKKVFKELSEGLQEACKSFIEFWDSLKEVFRQAFKSLIDYLNDFPKIPPRVLYLAFKHPSHRIRNKNRNRIAKIYRRWSKYHR